MHIAAALKNHWCCNGPTSAGFTPPLHQKQNLTTKLDCQPCFKRECPLKLIVACRAFSQKVLQAMQEWLSNAHFNYQTSLWAM